MVGITLSILAFILGVMFIPYLDTGVLMNQRQRADIGTASFLQSAIQTYVIESDDKDLVHLGNKLTVESIVDKLKGEIVINGVKYGPYIKESFKASARSKYKGFKITYDKKDQLVTVIPSKKGNSVVIKN